MFADFFGKRRMVRDRPAGLPADEPVIFPNEGQRPGWATATGLFATLGRTLPNRGPEEEQPRFPMDLQYAASLLERREPKTQAATMGWATLLCGQPPYASREEVNPLTDTDYELPSATPAMKDPETNNEGEGDDDRSNADLA